MRRIIEGAAYDTGTAELIKQVWWDDMEQQTTVLHRTRNGAFFFYCRYLTPNDDMKEELAPCSDQAAQEWLEKYASELVEQYFGQMPEGGAAERRFTLRMPNNLAKRLDDIAQAKDMPLNRYINKCLERCAFEDGKPATVV
jgi:predicted HicB family RNase H-like nuclease